MEKDRKMYINIKESPSRIFTMECKPNKEIKYLIESIFERIKYYLDKDISYFKEKLNTNQKDSFYLNILEERIKERNEISYDKIRLFFEGQELDNNKKFSDYNIIALIPLKIGLCLI